MNFDGESSGLRTLLRSSLHTSKGWQKQHSMEQSRTQTLCRFRVIYGAGRVYT